MSPLQWVHQSCCLLLAHPLNRGHVAHSGSGNTSTSVSVCVCMCVCVCVCYLIAQCHSLVLFCSRTGSERHCYSATAWGGKWEEQEEEDV